jgi:hypothetical protein
MSGISFIICTEKKQYLVTKKETSGIQSYRKNNIWSKIKEHLATRLPTSDFIFPINLAEELFANQSQIQRKLIISI